MNIAIPAPMLAPETPRLPFTDRDWLYEIKFDGYRCMAAVDGGQVQLLTKSGTDCTKWFPEVTAALAKIPGGPHVIDGEACVLDEIGRSDFQRFRTRASHRRWYAGCDQVTLCAFDILIRDGERVTGLPLVERKALLMQLLAGTPKQCVLYVGDLPADASLFRPIVVGLELEGVMAKRRASTYQPGTRSYDWRKIKRKGAVPPGRFERGAD